ncbi:hypothetical protein B0J15DRAFT_476505 [Fusarium solani]|uniref:Uncharacterized protein n=1 Tax=Fusarium solani TaxID=169388 RepID=A0A9P9L8B4_FUSSL|nr:uncharacterized protein B0J15DRAFT_476505 [Fusarium solani]KAH7276074.1 hypothetical protein B0J15DRAFT_476505 [Fusarium solani]
MKFITVLAVLLPVVYALPYSSDRTPKVTKVLRVERVEDSHDQVVFGLETPQSDTHDQFTQRPVPSLTSRLLLFLSRTFDDFTERIRIVLGGDGPDVAYDNDGVRYEVSTRCDENNRRVRVLRIKSKGQPATYRIRYQVKTAESIVDDGGRSTRKPNQFASRFMLFSTAMVI